VANLDGCTDITAARAPGSRSSLEEGCEGALFVEGLPGLEAVVDLAEEAVQQVPLCGGMPVTMLASAPVVRVRFR
jgi:hypothetical protein